MFQVRGRQALDAPYSTSIANCSEDFGRNMFDKRMQRVLVGFSRATNLPGGTSIVLLLNRIRPSAETIGP